MKICKKCGFEFERKSGGGICSVCKNGLDRYGLDRNQQISLLESQGNTCAICDDPISLHVRRDSGYKMTGNIDHCHKNNVVRGVLCHACNVTLGYLEDKNIDLDRVKKYASVSGAATNGD
jgi:Recombination endonuclease VII